VLGLAASLVATRVLAQQVWNVSRFDPWSFALVTLVLFAAGLQACLWPAWRAAKTPPTIALQQE
jgi:putative ABC transport system permease protein